MPAPVEYHCIACGYKAKGYEVYTFGDVILDEAECRLDKDGRSFYLQPKHFVIISTLMKRPEMLFRGETLMDVADIATEGSFRTQISKIRRILGLIGLGIEHRKMKGYKLVFLN